MDVTRTQSYVKVLQFDGGSFAWPARADSLPQFGASDLHVEGGSAVVVRVGGELRAVGEPVAGAEFPRVRQASNRPSSTRCGKTPMCW